MVFTLHSQPNPIITLCPLFLLIFQSTVHNGAGSVLGKKLASLFTFYEPHGLSRDRGTTDSKVNADHVAAAWPAQIM